MTIEEIIKNLNVDLANEYAHWHFYKNASIKIKGLHRAELKEFLSEKADEESGHITQFGELILGLGGVPVTSPGLFRDLSDARMIIDEAIAMEMHVASNFVERIRQAEELSEVDPINSKYIAVFLEDQLLDSKKDADELKQMLEGI